MEYIDLEEQVGNLTDDEIKILRVMSSKVMHIDEIIINSALQADRALAALTQLELKGFATDAGGKHFQLNVKTK